MYTKKNLCVVYVTESVFETLGGLSSSTVCNLSYLGRLIGQRLGISPSDSTRHLFQRCDLSLWRGNAALWIRRLPTFVLSVDGVTCCLFCLLFVLLFFLMYMVLYVWYFMLLCNMLVLNTMSFLLLILPFTCCLH